MMAARANGLVRGVDGVLVNHHLEGCAARVRVQAARAAFDRPA
jgi:hypothetical protein